MVIVAVIGKPGVDGGGSSSGDRDAQNVPVSIVQKRGPVASPVIWVLQNDRVRRRQRGDRWSRWRLSRARCRASALMQLFVERTLVPLGRK